MKRCPYCAEEIQDAAIVCRFCNRPLVAETNRVTGPRLGRRQQRLIAVIAVSTLAVLFALSRIISPNSPRPPAAPAASAMPAPKNVGSKAGAYTNCKQLVERRLRAPSTAKFQSAFSANIADLGDGMYTVTSYVDSQNGFGAMLRSTWRCTVNYDQIDGGWKLNSIEFSK